MSRPGVRRPLPSCLLLILSCLLAFPAALSGREESSLYDYVLTDLEGNATSLSTYRGRILVVEFFATWCPPCRKDLPEVASLREKYSPDRVAFVAISADGVSKTVHRLPAFIRETGVDVPTLIGGGILVDRYAGVERRSGREISLPQTYIFSGEGEILMRLVGDQKFKKKTLADELERILKEGSPREAGP